MKKTIFTAVLLALAMPVLAKGPTQEHTTSEVLGMQVKEFARKGSQVVVDLDMNLSAQRIRPTERWVVTPSIVSGNMSEALPPIVVDGNNKRMMARRAQILSDGWENFNVDGALVTENLRSGDERMVNYHTTAPYRDWMRGATLRLDTKLMACSSSYDLAENLSTLNVPEPYAVSPKVVYLVPVKPEVKSREIVATAFVDFAVNNTNIVRDFRSNPAELDKIKATLDRVRGNKDMTFRSISLEGYASPEGSYANNERLASGRVNALKDYVAKNFGVRASDVRVGHVAEDWKGLREEVDKSSIEAKSEILAIIDGTDAPDAREARLKAVAGGRPWRTILTEMMPPLRRTDYKVDFTVRDYTVQDSRAVLRTDPTLLSHYELDALAREFGPRSPEYAQIYEIIERQNPNDDAANTNVAAYRIERGDWAGARRALARIRQKGAGYYNNEGIVLLHEGKYQEALDAFRRAGNNADALHNVGEVTKYLESVR